MRSDGRLLLCCSFGGLAFSYSIHAQGANICSSDGYHVGFFNGAWSPSYRAHEALEYLQSISPATYQGESVNYGLYYNTTVTNLLDLFETLKQRAIEQDPTLADRPDTFFWDMLGGSGGIVTTVAAISAANPAASVFLSSLQSDALRSTALMLFHPSAAVPTQFDYADQRKQLDDQLSLRRKIVLVAHSQGSLFMNVAYAYGVGIVGANSIKAVHIGPASIKVNDYYTLADSDVVINTLLRGFGVLHGV